MMAAITASMVAELRAKTDAPMMECKKALTEAEGDMERAEELLRVKLGNKASKAASRVTAEGIVAAHIADGVGVLVELNCETDFVAKNDDFLAFGKTVAEIIAKSHPADVAALSALPLESSTVDAVRLALIGKIGENVSVRRFVRFESANKLASYLHGTRIGVLVEFTGADEQVGKDVAMHVAAMKPVSLSSDDVPAELIAKERSIAEQKAADLATLAIELVGVGEDLQLVREAAKLKASKKMAYADCFAAALARLRNVELVTGDPEFKEVDKEIKISWLK